MGKMKDAFISGSTDKELNAMVDNAKGLYDTGYVEFLEEQLEIRDKALEKLKQYCDNIGKILDEHFWNDNNNKESL